MRAVALGDELSHAARLPVLDAWGFKASDNFDVGERSFGPGELAGADRARDHGGARPADRATLQSIDGVASSGAEAVAASRTSSMRWLSSSVRRRAISTFSADIVTARFGLAGARRNLSLSISKVKRRRNHDERAPLSKPVRCITRGRPQRHAAYRRRAAEMSEEFEKLAAILSDFGTATIIERRKPGSATGTIPRGFIPSTPPCCSWLSYDRAAHTPSPWRRRSTSTNAARAVSRPPKAKTNFSRHGRRSFDRCGVLDLEHIIREAGGKLW